MNTIASGNCLRELHFLLEFLAAWEERPECLTPIAYRWCSVISEAAGRLEWGEITMRKAILLHLRLQLQDLALGEVSDELEDELEYAEDGFSGVARPCDIFRLDGTSHRAHGRPQGLTIGPHANLLSTILEIGFRLVTPGSNQRAPRLNHTPHHNRMFETAFLSDDDEVIADALSVWIADGRWTPPGSCVCYLAKRVGCDVPFSTRLRWVSIHVVGRIGCSELRASRLETVRLLNRLDVDVDDAVERPNWVRLLVEVIGLPAGPEGLSSHYWRLLGKLALGTSCWIPGLPSVEVMGLLEKAGDWEKLEVWMMVMWQSLDSDTPVSVMGDVERVTLKLLMRRASALERFKDLCICGSLQYQDKAKLRWICDQEQAEQLPFESPPPPYVSVHPAQYPSVLMPPFVCLSQPIHAQPLVPLPFAGDETF